MGALKRRLQVHGILGSDWSGVSMAESLSTSTNKAGVRQSSNFGYGRSSGTEANATTQRQRLLKYPDAAKDYFFCHQSLYPVTGDKPNVLTPKNRKRGLDELLELPPRTKVTRVGANLLEQIMLLAKCIRADFKFLICSIIFTPAQTTDTAYKILIVLEPLIYTASF